MFRSGDVQGPFFKITRGLVGVSRTLDDGRRQLLMLAAPGDCAGYLARDGCYEFEGEALTDVEACSFDRRAFDAFAIEEPELGAALADTLAQVLSRAARNMVAIGQLDSTERVANFLTELCRRYDERGEATQPLVLHMRRSEVADYLGLTLETVSRALGRLRKRKLIETTGGDAILILDHRKLAELAKAASI